MEPNCTNNGTALPAEHDAPYTPAGLLGSTTLGASAKPLESPMAALGGLSAGLLGATQPDSNMGAFLPQIVSHPEPPGSPDQAIFDAAEKYIGLGWRVLPFDRDKGICPLTKEAEAVFTCTPDEIAAKFSGFDIGIDVAASGLVDLDVDCAEAVPFIEWLLPKTATIGREGKSVSHLLFKRQGEVKHESFKDLYGKELLAILPKVRLALPPSPHRKTGEPLTWRMDCAPVQIGSELTKIAGEIAALALITRHWPGKGNHHHATLALAGTLARANWPLDKSLDAVKLICTYVQDPKVEERREEVKSTYERYKNGEADITGLPTLAEELASATAPGQVEAIKSRLHDWLRVPAQTNGDQPGADLGKYVLSAAQLMMLPIPQPEYLVDPFVPKPSLVMVFARRGAGKTWFTLQLAIRLARGEDFFAWPVPKPRRVLLIDGEMPTSYLNYRLKALLGGVAPPDNLRLLPVDQMWRDNERLTINIEADQNRIEQCLLELAAKGWRPDLIIFDNLSSLMAGVDENSNSDLDGFLRWLVKLRSLGHAVLIVHHAGKDGKQRGASRREDLLDTSIELVEQNGIGLETADGASFEIRFSKLRGERPHPDRLCVALMKNDDGTVKWQMQPGEEISPYMHVLHAIQDSQPATQTELVPILKMTKQAINKHVKTARDKGLLMPGGITLTAKGKDEVKKCFAHIEAADAML